MKHLGIIFLLVITSLLLTSCLETDSTNNPQAGDSGYLKIMNNTDAPITVTWAEDNSFDIIDANSYTTFEIPMRSRITDPKGRAVSYSCEGLYILTKSYTSSINENQTATRNFNAVFGCLAIINNTDAPVTVTWAADDSEDFIEANSSRTFRFPMLELKNRSILTTYSCEGLYLAPTTYTDLIDLGDTTTRLLYSASGFLKIVNNTNAPVTIVWLADDSQVSIEADSYRIFEFAMENAKQGTRSISATYAYSGSYLHSATVSDIIDLGQTTIRTLNPDRGCIRFINNTAGYVDLTIPGLDEPITIDANSDYTQAWVLSQATALASFSVAGTFVFEESDQMTIHMDETGSYAIYATGAAIKVHNNSSSNISQVYLSLHSDTTWGSNDLSGSIAPGGYTTWTVSANTWDVKVVDEQGGYETWTINGYLDLNDMLLIEYSLPTKQSDTSGKMDGAGSSHNQQSRIKQVLMKN